MSMSIQMALSHVAFVALRTVRLLVFPSTVVSFMSLCCDMQTQVLKNVSVDETQFMRSSVSSTVLNGQPTTHGLPPFLTGSPGFESFLALACRLIHPCGLLVSAGQTNTLSKYLRR